MSEERNRTQMLRFSAWYFVGCALLFVSPRQACRENGCVRRDASHAKGWQVVHEWSDVE